jgi:GT2 family glycosyltransferase
MTKECVDSIYAHTAGLSFEVILVDNASSDGSQEFFSHDDQVRFIESGSNLGFGRANNLGLKSATGKYAFLLNTDTLLKNNAVKLFFDYAEAHSNEKFGALGCRLVDGEGQPAMSCGNFLKIKMIFQTLTQHFGHVPDIYGKKKLWGDKRADAVNVDYICGADIFVNKQVIERFGAFDPDFFMYYEETEMQHRWGKNGYGSRLIDGPKIVHLEGGSFKKKVSVSRKAYNKKALINRRSEILFFKKCYSKPYYFLYRCCFFLYVVNDLLSRMDKRFVKDEWKLACTGDFE